METSDNERYDSFIRQIASAGEIWLLQAFDGMFAMFEDEDENHYIPVWPSKSEAESHIKDDWEEYTADRMRLAELSKWAYELKEDDILIAANPDLDLKVFSVDPIEFLKHIKK